MNPITLEQYFGGYLNHPDATPERKANAALLLQSANAGLSQAEDDGVVLNINPTTGTYISGSGHGGFRPQVLVDADGHPIGAGKSEHKEGNAIDPFDPDRELARWSLRNQEQLKHLGIRGMENPMWTVGRNGKGWVHWQRVAVKSGRFIYVPNDNPPVAEALPEQQHAFA